MTVWSLTPSRMGIIISLTLYRGSVDGPGAGVVCARPARGIVSAATVAERANAEAIFIAALRWSIRREFRSAYRVAHASFAYRCPQPGIAGRSYPVLL